VTFDWRIYAEATCAGLTALIPLPFVDLAFEAYFRRSMPSTISSVRGRELAAGARSRLGRGLGKLVSLEGCLAIPFGVAKYIVKKLWRKIVYVFAITDSTSLVSSYWHRAYLLDHATRAGHFGPDVDWRRSVAVFEKVLTETDTGPLMGIARQTVGSVHRVLRLLILARRRGAAGETESLSTILRSNWDVAERSLMETAVRYNAEFARSLERSPPAESTEADFRQPGRDDG
jgi:hypothetical protein